MWNNFLNRQGKISEIIHIEFIGSIDLKSVIFRREVSQFKDNYCRNYVGFIKCYINFSYGMWINYLYGSYSNELHSEIVLGQEVEVVKSYSSWPLIWASN
jgi:hypothetical protein